MTPADLATWLEGRRAHTAALPMVVGFDAFVDQVQEVVRTRQQAASYVPMATIADFSAWTAAAAGRSGLREVVTTARTMGGCAVNSGDGLAALGFPVTAFAGVGEPMDPVFLPFQAVCRQLDALGMAPGRSTVYEFADGKLMLCETAHFSAVTPAWIQQPAIVERVRHAVAGAAGLLLTAWSVYPHMTACWRALQHAVLAPLAHRPRILVDLADPAGRSPEDLQGMAEALAGFGPATTLSLNGNEAQRVAVALGVPTADLDERAPLEAFAGRLRQRLGIDEVGIHTRHMAASAQAQGVVSVVGPYCPRPRRSVGAGDRFNAGWLAGHALGLPQAARLTLACAVSGAFVRQAQSPSCDAVITFLRQWAAGTLDHVEPS